MTAELEVDPREALKAGASILRVFTSSQVDAIARLACTVKAVGFGEILLTFKNGHPYTIQVTTSEKMEE